MRITAFAGRNIKEILRDPLSYVFCFGFPVIMLVLMSIINRSIPPEANMTVFRTDNLCAGISVFGLTFMMLMGALLISKDRSTSFLTRLYASPMTAAEFIFGYYLPLVVLAILQCVVTFAASFIVGLVTDVTFNIENMLLGNVMLIPSMILFIGIGLLAGSKFSDKAAPGLCSVIISAASILGGVFMDVDTIGGTIKTVCNDLPFYHSVKAARRAIAGDLTDCGTSLLILGGYTVVVVVLSILAFRSNMKKD